MKAPLQLCFMVPSSKVIRRGEDAFTSSATLLIRHIFTHYTITYVPFRQTFQSVHSFNCTLKQMFEIGNRNLCIGNIGVRLERHLVVLLRSLIPAGTSCINPPFFINTASSPSPHISWPGASQLQAAGRLM